MNRQTNPIVPAGEAHYFTVNDACHHTLADAVILQDLRYWLSRNRINEYNIRDGYYWSYDSAREIAGRLPYLKRRTINNRLRKLENKGIVKSSNYNAKGYDRTKWYTIPDEYNVNCPPKDKGGYCTFLKDDALRYGLVKAVILYNFRYRENHNRLQSVNIKNGRAWVENTVGNIVRYFEFIPKKTVHDNINSLLNKGVLITEESGNRDSRYWAVNDGSESPIVHSDTTRAKLANGGAKLANGGCETCQPIPYKDIPYKIYNRDPLAFSF